jgi:hypothetical protein
MFNHLNFKRFLDLKNFISKLNYLIIHIRFLYYFILKNLVKIL